MGDVSPQSEHDADAQHAGAAVKRHGGAVVALLVFAVVFAALGVWQVQRLAWKTRLIAQTEAAIHAAPVDPATLPAGDLAAMTFRRLAVTGHFLPDATTLVTGTSELGTGYWELVPLVSDRGGTVMINRGFLPEGSKVDQARRGVPTGPVHIEGLLRPTEPRGTFLRTNQPDRDRWYSRDIAAIAARRGIVVDPRLFIDSWTQVPPAGPGQPTGGLTIVAFVNNHLQYALTWFALALMALGGAIMIRRKV